MGYVATPFKDEFEIEKLITFYYFEFAKDYMFEGESHNFWEFIYVDKGEVEVMCGEDGYQVKQGEIIFHQPNEFHTLWANGVMASNVMVVSFICESQAMDFFKGKWMAIDDKQRNLLANMIQEGKDTLHHPLDKPLKQLQLKTHHPFGSQQLIKIYLQQLLISLVRSSEKQTNIKKISSTVKQRYDDHTITKIITYLEEQIDSNLSFEMVCEHCQVSATQLKVLFKQKVGTSVMDYYKTLKIEKAKRMIREKSYNFTQISQQLGFQSIHTFSRCFKTKTNMTPSEYAQSVKVKL